MEEDVPIESSAPGPPVLLPAWSRSHNQKVGNRASDHFIESLDDERHAYASPKNPSRGATAKHSDSINPVVLVPPPRMASSKQGFGEGGGRGQQSRKPPGGRAANGGVSHISSASCLRNNKSREPNINNNHNHYQKSAGAEEFSRATSLPLPVSSTRYRSTSLLPNHHKRALLGSTSDLAVAADRSAGDLSGESVAGATHAMAISIAQGRGNRLGRLNSGSMTQMAGLGLSSQDLPSFVGDDMGSGLTPSPENHQSNQQQVEAFTKAVTKLSRRMSATSLSEQQNGGGDHTPKSGSPSQQLQVVNHNPYRENLSAQSQQAQQQQYHHHNHSQMGNWRSDRFPRPVPRCSGVTRVSCSPPRHQQGVQQNPHFNSMRRRRCDSPARWGCSNNGTCGNPCVSPVPALQQSAYTLRRLTAPGGTSSGAVRRSSSHTKLDKVCVRPDSPFCSWCASSGPIQQQFPMQNSNDLDSPQPPNVSNYPRPMGGNRSRSSSRSSARQQNLRSPRGTVFLPPPPSVAADKMTTNLDENIGPMDEKALVDGLLMVRMGNGGYSNKGGGAISPRLPPPELPVSPSGRKSDVMAMAAARRRKYRPARPPPPPPPSSTTISTSGTNTGTTNSGSSAVPLLLNVQAATSTVPLQPQPPPCSPKVE
ncbi:hypothetical protein Aperf_G00000124765 [Anoplocephala perfoliata]